jgi:hypothetical protein
VVTKSKLNEDNLNDVRHETNRSFRNKKKEYLKKINELDTNSKNKTVTDLSGGRNEFKKGYHPRTE